VQESTNIETEWTANSPSERHSDDSSVDEVSVSVAVQPVYTVMSGSSVSTSPLCASDVTTGIMSDCVVRS